MLHRGVVTYVPGRAELANQPTHRVCACDRSLDHWIHSTRVHFTNRCASRSTSCCSRSCSRRQVRPYRRQHLEARSPLQVLLLCRPRARRRRTRRGAREPSSPAYRPGATGTNASRSKLHRHSHRLACQVQVHLGPLRLFHRRARSRAASRCVRAAGWRLTLTLRLRCPRASREPRWPPTACRLAPSDPRASSTTSRSRSAAESSTTHRRSMNSAMTGLHVRFSGRRLPPLPRRRPPLQRVPPPRPPTPRPRTQQAIRSADGKPSRALEPHRAR